MFPDITSRLRDLSDTSATEIITWGTASAKSSKKTPMMATASFDHSE